MENLKIYLFAILIFCNASIFSSNYSDNDSPEVIRLLELLDSSAQSRNVSLEKSISICQQAIVIAENVKDSKYLSKSYKTQGINYFFAGTYDSAFVYYEKSIPHFEAINSNVDVGKILGNIGLLYRKQGKYDKALEYYLNNLKIYKKNNYKKGLGCVFNNLGNLHFEQEDFIKAKTYYQFALENFIEFENTKEIANAYCNLGAIAELKKEFTKSLDYYNKSLLENSKIGNILFESKLLYNIGFLYHSQTKLDSAFAHVKRAEKIRINIGDKDGIISAKVELGRILSDKGNYKLAEKYLLKANEMAIENDLLKWRVEILRYLTEIYQKSGDYKNSFLRQSEMIQMNDSLKSIQSNIRFNELSAAYDAEKREKELALLKQEGQIHNLQMAEKNAWIITLMVVLLLGVVAIVVSLRINRLRADHKILDLRQKVLLTQMNPHFLFNSLTAIQSFILDKRNDDANIYLSRLASLVRGILENSREEFVPLQTELETLKDYIELQKLRFENEIAYQFEIDDEIDQEYTLVPPMLAQPFVENALIHGMLRNKLDAEIKVKISLSNNQKLLRFQIEDNGIGIEQAQKQNTNKNHKSIATSIALDRVKIYNFKSSKKMNFEIIDLKNKDSKRTGTQVCYTIPLTLIQE